MSLRLAPRLYPPPAGEGKAASGTGVWFHIAVPSERRPRVVQLLATGVDPDTPLRVYRRGVLALKVRSIREGARLTVKTAGNGTPIFTLDDP